MGQWRPVDTLRDWAERNVLGVTRDDVAAWNQIRHPSAHGSFIVPTGDRAETQTRLSHFYRILNVMNRIILQLVEYNGPYADYSQQNWPEVEFPRAVEGSFP
jgi:hypothetical protein